MKLLAFRVQNFRSINDSGEILLDKNTALVGRNESGKTNLLLALHSLNPVNGAKPLNPVKDFPRDRMLDDQNETTPVVTTRWSLTEDERASLSTEFPRSAGTQSVIIKRDYGAKHTVEFSDLAALSIPVSEITDYINSLKAALNHSTSKLDNNSTDFMMTAVNQFVTNVEISPGQDPVLWATHAESSCNTFRTVLNNQENLITDNAEELLERIVNLAIVIKNDATAHKNAKAWVLKTLPTFIYLDDYPELDGRQDIAAYEKRRSESKQTTADRNFEKLLKVAGLNATELHKLLTREPEKRQQLANRAGATITKRLRELWSDRSLKVRFNLDAKHFSTLISGPNNLYDVEVNLDERSRGFKWFFSFYITFAADTQNGAAESAILLLDEPGLYLHAVAQRDLLNHFKSDFENQIIYTTHSPFMIPSDNLKSVKTVNISVDDGTTVTNDPSGDSKTLFPLQSALGYDLAQNLFIGSRSLVVEGVSDYWYLQTVSAYLNEQFGSGLDEEIVITPAGGAQRIPYMVALLSSQNLNVVVLLDAEKRARRMAREELAKTKLMRSENVLFASDAFEEERKWADIEDLLCPSRFHALVEESCAAHLDGRKLDLNPKIPRIAKRYEAAFRALDCDFFHTTPARLFLNNFPAKPELFLEHGVQERFERLFRQIELRFKKVTQQSNTFV